MRQIAEAERATNGSFTLVLVTLACGNTHQLPKHLKTI